MRKFSPPTVLGERESFMSRREARQGPKRIHRPDTGKAAGIRLLVATDGAGRVIGNNNNLNECFI